MIKQHEQAESRGTDLARKADADGNPRTCLAQVASISLLAFGSGES